MQTLRGSSDDEVLLPVQSPSATRTTPFANCNAARAAGAAPVRRGEGGYGAHLDRDGDGVGCEPYRR
ncbi:hypothetical protein GC173_12215 [bacterium]|nr:hypothetical protein [bacterium]